MINGNSDVFSFQGNKKSFAKQIGSVVVSLCEDSNEEFQELNSLLRRHGFGEATLLWIQPESSLYD